MQKIKKYICKVYIPHSSDKTTVYAAKALDLVEVYIPHSSDKTTGQILSFTDTIYVYIPHSSDKTFTSLPMNSKSNLFTSLIVQIRRQYYASCCDHCNAVYIPHSSDKTCLLQRHRLHQRVYIPHSSDKTCARIYSKPLLYPFTSLIVQIRRRMAKGQKVVGYEFTSLIVQIRLTAHIVPNIANPMFTSLIVQIRPEREGWRRAAVYNVYIPHSSDKTAK